MTREPLSPKNRQTIVKRDKNRCQKCWRVDGLEVHHINHCEHGGTDEEQNLITLCAACHGEWHAVELVSPVDFGQWLTVPPTVELMTLWLKLFTSQNIGEFQTLSFSDGVRAILQASQMRKCDRLVTTGQE